MGAKEREELLNQANLYLQGYSYRDIAKIYGVSHITIRNNLIKRLKEIDLRLYYEVLDKISLNTEKNITDENVRRRVLESYKLLVLSDLEVREIASIMQVEEFVTYRDLTKRLNDLHNFAPNIVTDEMLEKARFTLRRHALDNIDPKRGK